MGFLKREIFVKWVYQSEKHRHGLKDNRGKERNQKDGVDKKGSDRWGGGKKDNVALM